MVLVRFCRETAAARVATARSQDDDGDESDQSDKDHGRDDAVAEYSPGGVTALLSSRSYAHTPTF